jgi:hypothetical protein
MYVRREDGGECIIGKTSILENTYEALIADIFKYEGIEVSLDLSEIQRRQFKYWIPFSKWACKKQQQEDTIEMFNIRLIDYLNECCFLSALTTLH